MLDVNAGQTRVVLGRNSRNCVIQFNIRAAGKLVIVKLAAYAGRTVGYPMARHVHAHGADPLALGGDFSQLTPGAFSFRCSCESLLGLVYREVQEPRVGVGFPLKSRIWVRRQERSQGVRVGRALLLPRFHHFVQPLFLHALFYFHHSEE